MHLGDAAVVARDEAVEDFGEEAPLLRPEPPHDAEIDRDDAPGVVDEQIAGMHVGVEEAVAQRVAQEGSGSPRGRARAGRGPGFERACDRTARVPSIHSSVSTSWAVRSQSTAGTRKSGSSLVFSAISDSAAASSRRSISIATERASVVDHFDQPQPARLGGKRFRMMRREGEGVEIGLEAPFDAGPQHLDRDRTLAEGSAIPVLRPRARCTCAIEAAATARAEARENLGQRAARKP